MSELVLLVEDSDELRELFCAYFQQRGFEVITAENGLEALHTAERNLPDVVVSDILMPVMDGFSLCRQWKSHHQLKTVPFVFYTATYTDPSDRELALELGADQFIIKPDDPYELVGQVEKLLQLKREGKLECRLPSSSSPVLERYSKVLLKKLESKMIELEEAHQLYLDVLDNLKDLIVVLDESNKIFWANLAFCRFCNKPLSQLRNQPLLSHSFAKASQELEEFLRKVRTLAPGQSFDDWISFLEGKRQLYFHILGVHLTKFARRTGPYVLLCFSDRTEEQFLIHQMIQSQKLEAVGRVTAGLAHDFSNILTAIWSNAEYLQHQFEKNERGYEEATSIVQLCQKASDLIQKIIYLGRPQETEEEKLPLLNVNQTIESIVPLLQSLAGKKIQIHLSLNPDLPFVEAYPEDLEQILLNLLVNTKDAMPEGGNVYISTSLAAIPSSFQKLYHRRVQKHSEYVLIQFRDEGPGIPSEILDKIFDPFFTTKEQGMGIGLSVIHNLVQMRHGYIFVDTELGKGTTFHIYLPVAIPSEESPSDEKGTKE